MNRNDKFLIAMLFGAVAFEFGPDLIKKFQEDVLDQKPRKSHPLVELVQKHETPAAEQPYEIIQP